MQTPGHNAAEFSGRRLGWRRFLPIGCRLDDTPSQSWEVTHHQLGLPGGAVPARNIVHSAASVYTPCVKRAATWYDYSVGEDMSVRDPPR